MATTNMLSDDLWNFNTRVNICDGISVNRFYSINLLTKQMPQVSNRLHLRAFVALMRSLSGALVENAQVPFAPFHKQSAANF